MACTDIHSAGVGVLALYFYDLSGDPGSVREDTEHRAEQNIQVLKHLFEIEAENCDIFSEVKWPYFFWMSKAGEYIKIPSRGWSHFYLKQEKKLLSS